MKIVVLDGYAGNPGDLSWAGLEQLGELTVYDRTNNADPDEIAGRIGDAEIVVTNKTLITAQTLERCPQVRYIGVLATGFNVVDTAAARARNIPVTNIPSYSTAAVAQLTIALLLEICHRTGHHDDAVHAGRWQNSVDFCFWDTPLIELAGKTFGIIGYGRIGQAVARAAAALGLKVLAHNRTPKEEGRAFAEPATLEKIYAEADIISLHCPMQPSTQGMINRDSIAKMKDGVILLNTSRGGLIVEQDLADALNSGKVYAAGVDVVSEEPIRAENPLLTAKNCIITPHIAWAPIEARTRMMEIAVANVAAFLDDKPVNVVN